MKITLNNAPTPEEMHMVGEQLRQPNEQYALADGDSRFALFLQDENGRILGGLIAKTGRGWFKIGSLWVDEAVRGQEYGRWQLETTETEGIRHGCHGAYLDTFSFQAPEFYEKCGYEIFGTLGAFPDEHKRFFMRKLLRHFRTDGQKE